MDDKKTNLSHQISTPDKYLPAQKPAVTPEAVAEAEKLKSDLEDLKKAIVKKFAFTMSLCVLPAHSFKYFEEDEGMLAEEVARKPLHVMLVVPEDEYKNIAKKIKPGVLEIIKNSKQNVWIHIKTPVDIWNYGLDSKFELIDAIGSSFPLYDKGFLGTLRLANIHKTLVLRKFEKYVASYVIGGSLARGTAGKESDVDTFVIIDDTDVKKMPRLQLLEKLRAYIYDYIKEANALAGVTNVLNVQVYLLTDFWQSVKDATPVIFTFIRDGIPMYDRGTFLPWKLLLKMGKIKPSPEAVDTFMKYGDQNESLVKRRLMDAMIDIYWGVITPTQALMMLAGHAPPVPKTMAAEVKQIFVDKEKIMGMRELKILEKTIKLYKDYEHGKLKSISGAEIDVLLKESKEYDTKLKELRKKLEDRLIEHSTEDMEKEVFGLLEHILENKNRAQLTKEFQSELIKKGKIPGRFSEVLKDIEKIRPKVKSKKATQSEIDLLRREVADLVGSLTEYAQRKDLVAVEKGVLAITYGDKKGEIILTPKITFLVEAGVIRKVGQHALEASNSAELEQALATSHEVKEVRVPSHALAILQKELGNFELTI